MAVLQASFDSAMSSASLLDAESEAMNRIDNFVKRVEIDHESGCWNWMGSKNGNTEYGKFSYRVGGQTFHPTAHRFCWETFVGPIPEGLEIDHLCGNKLCVNPDHLEPVTHAENCRRRNTSKHIGEFHRAKTHCPHGHPYSGENLYVNPQGKRECRICKRARTRAARNARNARNMVE
jgi:hypothetical protein